MAERFLLNHSEQYTLSIRLSTDGFSFSVYCPSMEPSFRYFPFAVNRGLSMMANVKEMLLQHDDLFQQKFRQIRIYVADARYVAVPLELFSTEKMEMLYTQTQPLTAGHTVLFNELPRTHVVMLFSLHKAVHQLLLDRFPEAKFYASVAPLTEYFAGKSFLGNCKKLYAYLQEGQLTVVGLEHGKLLLLNSFPCKQSTDYLYYLLYIWKTLELDQQRDELHLVGLTHVRKLLAHELQKFIRQVYHVNPSAEFNRMEYSRVEEMPFDLQTTFSTDL